MKTTLATTTVGSRTIQIEAEEDGSSFTITEGPLALDRETELADLMPKFQALLADLFEQQFAEGG